MNSKDLIKKVINFDNPDRIGFNFNSPHPSDILWMGIAKYKEKPFSKWGRHKELLRKIPDFPGEVYQDSFGNIIGRINGKTNGEVVCGVLEGGWELLDTYKFPEIDLEYEKTCKTTIQNNNDKFILAVLPISPFGTMRKMRKMENFLMDTVLSLPKIQKLGCTVMDKVNHMIEYSAKLGGDAICIYEDWGTQNALLIDPIIWRKLFKPMYKEMATVAHRNGLAFFMHSCGYIYEIIEDLIEIGVDTLQLDQPELLGVKKLADEFGGKISFWSPVDIQRNLQSGNKKIIQEEARLMIKELGKLNGGFIAKDYPSLADIDVKDEWAQWARDIFINEGIYFK